MNLIMIINLQKQTKIYLQYSQTVERPLNFLLSELSLFFFFNEIEISIFQKKLIFPIQYAESILLQNKSNNIYHSYHSPTMKSQTQKAQRYKDANKTKKKDKNINFFQLCDNKFPDKRSKDVGKEAKTIDKIVVQLEKLESVELEEWKRLGQLKCLQLYKTSKENDLKPYLRQFITVCNKLEIQYDYELVEGIIKEIYFKALGQEVIQVFKKSGFNCQAYNVLNYSPSWFQKAISIFSDIF